MASLGLWGIEHSLASSPGGKVAGGEALLLCTRNHFGIDPVSNLHRHATVALLSEAGGACQVAVNLPVPTDTARQQLPRFTFVLNDQVACDHGVTGVTAA